MKRYKDLLIGTPPNTIVLFLVQAVVKALKVFKGLLHCEHVLVLCLIAASLVSVLI